MIAIGTTFWRVIMFKETQRTHANGRGGMMIATCGHKVDEGITCSVDEGQIMSDGSPAISYGTYCAECIEGYYREGRLENGELKKLLNHTAEAYERMEFYKNQLKERTK